MLNSPLGRRAASPGTPDNPDTFDFTGLTMVNRRSECIAVAVPA